MPFDPTTAKPAGAFDPTSAQPAADGAAPVNADRAPQGTDIGQDAAGDAGSMLWAALHGAADTATFGLADKAAAGLAHMISPATGKPMTYDEAFAKIQANNAKSTGNSPVSALVGDVAGVAAGAGGIAKVASKIPGVAGAAEALAPVKGQSFRNVGKMAATSGASAGAYTAADDLARKGDVSADNTLLSTAVGAVVGPVVSKVGMAIAKGVQSASTRAMTVLADKLGETPATLQRVYDNFSAATGRVPTMAELVGMKSQGELKTLAQNNPVIQQSVNEAADVAGNQRQQSLAQVVENAGGPAQDISQLTQARTSRMTAAMDPIRTNPVAIENTDLGLLTDPRTRAAVRATRDPQLLARYNDAVQEIGDHGQSEVLSLNDVDSIRKSLRNEQSNFANPQHPRHNTQAAQAMGNLADNVGALGTASEPGYADALAQFEQDSHYIKGFKHGNAGKSLGEADNADLIRSLNEPEGIAGHQAGIVSRTSDRAAANPDSAVRMAEELAQGGGDSATLRGAIGQQRFSEVEEAAGHEARGAESLRNISGSVKPRDEGVKASQVAQAVGAAGSHSPAGVLFHLSRVIPSFDTKLPAAVQQQVARYLTTPSMTQQGINLLRRAGATDAQLRKLAVALSANAGLNTSATLNQ